MAPGRIHSVRQRLGSDIVRQMVHDYEAGQSTAALTQAYGLSKGTVLRILKEQDVPMRGQGLPDGKLPEATRLYLRGWSLKRVGNHYRCSAETIRLALNGAGVPLRKPWERMP